jgi:2,5-diamino-6-(ribosylamino)-4(3H)-pyrimidinone 5'-phosphate reductase
MEKPITTLFLIQSLDGKITTGDSDALDVDKDFPHISGVKEGLYQYYDLEKLTDPFSLNTGRVMAKIGVNTRTTVPTKIGCSFIIIDNKPHLTEKGTTYMAQWVNKLFLVTTNPNHPAFKLRQKYPNIELIFFDTTIDLSDLLEKLKNDYGIEKLTIQSGGTLNTSWIRDNLIDYVSIVIAPCLIGGTNTQSLLGGESLHSQTDLSKIKALELLRCDVLKHSYIHITYKVRPISTIDTM